MSVAFATKTVAPTAVVSGRLIVEFPEMITGVASLVSSTLMVMVESVVCFGDVPPSTARITTVYKLLVAALSVAATSRILEVAVSSWNLLSAPDRIDKVMTPFVPASASVTRPVAKEKTKAKALGQIVIRQFCSHYYIFTVNTGTTYMTVCNTRVGLHVFRTSLQW